MFASEIVIPGILLALGGLGVWASLKHTAAQLEQMRVPVRIRGDRISDK